MGPTTVSKPAARLWVPCLVFHLFALLANSAGAEANLPPGISAPPPPFTQAVDRNAWVLEALTQLYPWREWSGLEMGSDKLGLSVAYVLKEPEFVQIKEKKTPDGRDLSPFYATPVVFVSQCRPAGDHGRLKAASVSWLAYPGSERYGYDNNRGKFTLVDAVDTPDDAKASVGSSLSTLASKNRVIDVGGAVFTEYYPKWIQQHQQYVALLGDRKLTKWSGVIQFPQGPVALQLQLHFGSVDLCDEKGNPIPAQITMRPELEYDLEITGDDYALVRIIGSRNLQTDEKGEIWLRDYIRDHPNPFRPADRRTVPDVMFVNFRLKIIDARTVRLSSVGIPATLFHLVP